MPLIARAFHSVGRIFALKDSIFASRFAVADFMRERQMQKRSKSFRLDQ
jgi:hypothetical protein